ncbi:hypothetical protein VOLCADRAFT_104865 [Volvox carteri f. nagariensis]|uniref:Plastid lipid-associated protein/fibrillin conserved domain-containing protein n=1 Tax=Volvox carteri f. nagariensis TaxID=3068 RepID=D8TWL9_VOLCA|nr:uncharacterized protein VOLCADRAFT_104865 [Volvox carteri f. nagariensis]EFJ48173.1 hypothetical protein VOLCADRAFT_104865 [Volvox carteri f. nagariensis]|eukprot:XP_002950858.1 hypothetical protein VOLCADRAFT_104865 [Volvox carteri f. nagariensis]
MQVTCFTPLRSGPCAIHRPSLSRRVHLPCRAAAAPPALSDIEKQALGTYRSNVSEVSKSNALQLLKRAAATKSIPAETVEGALLALEQIVAQEKSSPTPSIAGKWRLVFGTATKFRPFQYIPVKEDFVLDETAKTLALESSLGPFDFFIRGKMNSWRPETGELDFQFNKVDILFSGNKVWEVTPKTKPKTYTFFYVASDLACARSSAGGVALLVK